MKSILITGGAGFIGSHTADFFLQQGVQVVVFDNLVTGKLTHLNLFHPNLRFVQADILNYKILETEIAQCDAVLHLAALPSVQQSIADPVQSLQINTQGFLHVLQAIRKNQEKNKKDIRLIYASSAAVYGAEAALPCSDESPLPLTVLSPYALEKANNERYAHLYAQLFSVKSLGLRYFNVYGPRQIPDSPYSGVISKFIANYQKKEPILIFGDGTQSRDFIHVFDVARANWLAMQSHYCGALNIATGVPETLINLISYIQNAGIEPPEIQFTDQRIGDIPISYASTDQTKKQLQFNYTIKLADGISNLLKQ
jgi:nucleoside-diphosphate-sugar epimerase